MLKYHVNSANKKRHYQTRLIFTKLICLFLNLIFIYLLLLLLFCLFAISWAAPAAYGGSQARGRIGAVAASLNHSHSNAGSETYLQPTPQLTATPDP